ncbi:hypothetical protein NLI96_g390 [Meripilus lineatus]|uniref:Uncharacterized protein n=1 Tax=Meripilus lineatus TaxID=2056292 RepID=A0AAD5YJC5_9APHY|nr:hypothetical protein NLI96_g390 [Physisporinus lineatus]
MDAAITPPLRVQPYNQQPISSTQAHANLHSFLSKFQDRNNHTGGDATVPAQLQKLTDALRQEQEIKNNLRGSSWSVFYLSIISLRYTPSELIPKQTLRIFLAPAVPRNTHPLRTVPPTPYPNPTSLGPTAYFTHPSIPIKPSIVPPYLTPTTHE